MSQIPKQYRTLRRLENASVLVMYHDYRSQSLLDFSGSDNSGTTINSGFFTHQGFQQAAVEVTDQTNTRLTTGCLMVLGTWHPTQGSRKLLTKRSGDTTNYEFQLSNTTTQLGFYDGSNVRTATFDHFTGRHCLAVNFSDGEVPDFYVDSTKVAGNASVSITTQTVNVTIGSTVGNTGDLGNIHEVALIFNRELTDTEIAQIFAEIKENYWVKKYESQAKAQFDLDLSDSSLIGAWEMKPINDTVIDRSSNGNDGTPVNDYISYEKNLLGYFARFTAGKDNRIDVALDYPNASDGDNAPFTCAVWFKPNNLTATTMLAAKSDSWRFAVLSSEAARFDIYKTEGGVTFISDTASQLNKFCHAVITYDGTDGRLYVNGSQANSATTTLASNGNAIDIGNLSTSFDYDGLIGEMKMYNEAKSATWVAREYKKGARTIQYQTNWGVRESTANVTAGELENSGWWIDSGTWKISTDTIESQNVKIIECIVAGVLYIPIDKIMTPTEAAFGSWEFWFNKSSGGNLRILLNSCVIGGLATAGQDTYAIYLASNESVRVAEYNNGSIVSWTIFGSADDYTHSTWHKMKCTRSNAGVFEIYLNDVFFDTGTDTTITTGNYINLQFDAGDKIAFSDRDGIYNFKKYLGVV